MASFRELLARDQGSASREIEPEEAEARLGAGHVPRRARARRVRAGHDPRLGLHPPRPPREPGRDQAPRPGRSRSSSTARAATARRSRPRRSSSSATPTSSRWPAASAGGRTRAGRGSRPQTLDPEQRNRYHRHILLPEVGEAGQQKLLESKVLLLGAGGLGSPAALYLAAAGVGTLGIVDMDVVDASNLQRQILHNIDRIGERKVDSAKKTLTAAQPRRRRRHLRRALRRRQRARHHRRLRRHRRRHRQLPDPLPAQRRVAAEAHPRRARVDLPVRGPGHGVRARTTGPCYRCLLPEPPPPELAPSCAEAGVLGVLPGIVGSIQALEAIKLHPRPRRPARRPAARLRRARAVVPHLQGAARPRVPGVRRERGADRDRRVRRPLPAPRHPAATAPPPDPASAFRGLERGSPARRACARRSRCRPS